MHKKSTSGPANKIVAPKPKRLGLTSLKELSNTFFRLKCQNCPKLDDVINEEVKRIVTLPRINRTSKACSAELFPARLSENPILKDSFFKDLECLSSVSTCDGIF